MRAVHETGTSCENGTSGTCAAGGKLGKERPLLRRSALNCSLQDYHCSLQDYLHLLLIVVYKKNQHLCLECHNSAHINRQNRAVMT